MVLEYLPTFGSFTGRKYSIHGAYGIETRASAGGQLIPISRIDLYICFSGPV